MDMIVEFRRLHDAGTFALPNPWDVGSARLLEHAGAAALATTSSGLAAALGVQDMHITRDQLVDHVAAVTAAVSIPVNVDAERCFAATSDDIAETVDLLAAAGAAGLSIEDYDPATDSMDPLAVAVERVAAAVEAARPHGLVVTARADNFIHGIDDLDDTLTRLARYRDGGADCLYAPGPADLATIRAIVGLGAPVNALLRPDGPTVRELGEAGARRVSVGGRLAFIAYGALMDASRELLTDGRISAPMLGSTDRHAFDLRPAG